MKTRPKAADFQSLTKYSKSIPVKCLPRDSSVGKGVCWLKVLEEYNAKKGNLDALTSVGLFAVEIIIINVSFVLNFAEPLRGNLIFLTF